MSDGNEIAIVGMAGRFPGCADLDTFWRNLRDGVELIRFPSEQELLERGVDPALVRDPTFVRAASSLEGMEEFDAAFFGILPREAQLLDPQHRLLLECAWEALEDAGYDTERVSKPIGLYAGVAMNGYLIFHLVNNPAVASAGYVAVQLASDKDYMPTRISYKLDLRGPSCLIQAACSTSLVALHTACQSLLSHECDMALAGGASVLVHNRHGYQHIEGGIFSPDGHCRSFDAAGRGTIFGSGVGLVVVKRLQDALSSGDKVLAVIRGSAINNDGAAKVGYTAPSVDGQAQVVAEALANAGVSADSISYVEGHGTATQLGDPIEVQALTKAFRASTRRQRFCALGSVKSNLGHLDAAAGITGVIKTVLALRHRQIPPTLHFRTPNPRVDWDDSPFFVSATLQPWAADPPRRAGVSSFGIGGTNAHLVLEEAPAPEPGAVDRPAHLLVLSARTPTALASMRARLADHLERSEPELGSVAYTLQVGRRVFGERLALVVSSREEAVRALRSAGPPDPLGRSWLAHEERRDRPVTFLFPGQGAQYVGMARELYAHEPVFRKELDRCATRLESLLGWDLRAEQDASLHRTERAQPALFAVEYALARWWAAYGVVPDAMIGHSLGEYVAACMAGVLTLDDALKIVAIRGQLTSECPPGAMLSVGLPVSALEPRLPADLTLAAVNAPAQCVVSGTEAAIERFEGELTREHRVRCRRLQVSHAFHSPLLEPMVDRFAAALRSVSLQPPHERWMSNVTGTWITPEQAQNPDYWVTHLTSPVRFSEGVAALLEDPGRILLEVGPGQALVTLARAQRAFAPSHLALTSLRHRTVSAAGEGSDVEHLLRTVGQLWVAGVTLDWTKFGPKAGRRRTSLPTYPFERERHWVEPVSSPWVVSGRAPAPTPAPATVPAPVSEAAVRSLLAEQLNILSLQVEILRERASTVPGARHHVPGALAEPPAADPGEADRHLQRDVRDVERAD
jgi:phthiocerol/phenolphthiocerol synthesis type-I polyketide synthase E